MSLSLSDFLKWRIVAKVKLRYSLYVFHIIEILPLQYSNIHTYVKWYAKNVGPELGKLYFFVCDCDFEKLDHIYFKSGF